MYLLVVSYTKSPEEVAPHLSTHAAWVKQHLDAGIFVFAGPKKSKLGGVILTKSIDKNTLTKILAGDSYVTADVAEYQIIDFDCKVAAQPFELLKTM